MQSGRYPSGMAALRGIAGKNPMALYKGMLSPLIGATPICAVSYVGYKWGASLSNKVFSEGQDNSKLIFAGAFSAIPQTLVTSPVERMKTVMQVRYGHIEWITFTLRT